MEFKQWLEEFNKLNESRKGPAPGAFGNSKKQGNYTNPNQFVGGSNKFADFNARVESGKQIESKILDALKTHVGWNIQSASTSEDKYDKIDGWIIENNQKTPLQIKYRDKASGSDIFMEVLKDYNKNIPGRDMIGKAKIYVTLANNTLMIRQADEAKKIASEMAEELRQKIATNPTTTRMSTSKGMIMISPDPATGVEKLKAYINPNAFVWKKNVALTASLF